MKEQDFLDFAPGEQEAAVRMAHDSVKISLALRRARRRWWKNVLTYVVILLLWLVYYRFLVDKLTDLTLSWTSGFELYVPWELYRLGRWSSLIVGFVLYGCSHQKWCLETGSHIKIRRAIIPSRLLAVLAVLVGLWLVNLSAFYAQWWLLAEWSTIPWLINLTGFVLVLFGYLMTVFSLDAFTVVSRERIVREEKWALGIFD